jgi:hypothetical protein
MACDTTDQAVLTLGDLEMERAINARDENRLAREIKRRLDSCTFGTGIAMRLGWSHPTSWRGTTKGKGAPEHKAMAREAAKALLRDAYNTENNDGL